MLFVELPVTRQRNAMYRLMKDLFVLTENDWGRNYSEIRVESAEILVAGGHIFLTISGAGGPRNNRQVGHNKFIKSRIQNPHFWTAEQKAHLEPCHWWCFIWNRVPPSPFAASLEAAFMNNVTPGQEGGDSFCCCKRGRGGREPSGTAYHKGLFLIKRQGLLPPEDPYRA